MMLQVVLERLLDGSLVHSLPQYVCGLAIAGSHARGEETPYSDLDLFIVLDASDRDYYGSRIEQVLGNFPPPLIRRGPVPIEHFGDSVTLVYSDASFVQVNFNTVDSIEVNPMRRGSRVLLDRRGDYNRLIEASRECSIDQNKLFAEYSNWFVIRAGFALRSVNKGELLKTTGYLHDMRIALTQLLRIATGHFYENRNPYLPSSRFEKEVGMEAARELGALLPIYGADALNESLRRSLELFWHIQCDSSTRYKYDLSPAKTLDQVLFRSGCK